MIKKAIKILAAAVVAIAAFAFAGTTEARAETLLSGNFSSIGQLDAQFDVYGDTPAVDGSLELLPEGETLVLSKRGDFDDFTAQSVQPSSRFDFIQVPFLPSGTFRECPRPRPAPQRP